MEKILGLFDKVKKKSVYAVYEDDLDNLLQSVGLKEKIESGEESCYICGLKMNRENLHGIIKINGNYRVICSKQTCYNSFNNKLI